MVVANNEIIATKNAGELVAILMTMGIQRYDARHIAWWSTSRLHTKPLDTAIGRVPASYCPGSRHGRQFRIKHTKHKQTQLLASNYSTFWALVVCENFIPQNRPSTQLIDATSFVQMWNATIGAKELAGISSYQTLSADKKWKSY